MTRNDVYQRVSEKTDLPLPESKKAVEAFISTIKESVACGDKVIFRKFGTFGSKEGKKKFARDIGRNKVIPLAPHRVPYFKFGRTFRQYFK